MEGLKHVSSPTRKTARVTKRRTINLNYDQMSSGSANSTKGEKQQYTTITKSKQFKSKLQQMEMERISFMTEARECKLRPRSSSMETVKSNRSADIPKKLLDAVKLLKEIDEWLTSTFSFDNKMLQDNYLTSIDNKSLESCSINGGKSNLNFKKFIMESDISETLLLLSNDRTLKDKLPKLSSDTIEIIEKKNHSHTIKSLIEAHEEMSSLRLLGNKPKSSTNLCKTLSKSCCNVNFFPVSEK